MPRVIDSQRAAWLRLRLRAEIGALCSCGRRRHARRTPKQARRILAIAMVLDGHSRVLAASQQERTEPPGPRRCRRGAKSSLRREPNMPADLLRAPFGNVTVPFGLLATSPGPGEMDAALVGKLSRRTEHRGSSDNTIGRVLEKCAQASSRAAMGHPANSAFVARWNSRPSCFASRFAPAGDALPARSNWIIKTLMEALKRSKYLE
jgi:hypothetical protein